MEQTIKQRLVGAVVLVSLAVIILPFVFDGQGVRQSPDGLFDMPDTRLNDTIPSDKPSFPDAPSNAGEIRAKKIDELKREAEIRNLISDEDADKSATTKTDENISEDKNTASPDSDSATIKESMPAEKLDLWRVQLATFGNEDPARRLAGRLRQLGHNITVQSERDADNLTWHVIVLVVVGTHDKAKQLSERLAKEYPDINQPIIRKGTP